MLNAAHHRWLAVGMLSAASFLMVGCSGDSAGTSGQGAEPPSTNPASSGGDPATSTELPVAGPGEAPVPDLSGVELPEGVTVAMVELGRQVFMGKEGGGTCFTCHGMNAAGGPLAPSQLDDRWLNCDGTYEGILQVTLSGVPKPKEAAVPMPPRGGAPLSGDQAKAVSAYIYALAKSSRGE